MAHAVYNVDDTVSVTENFLPATTLDLLAVHAAHGWRPLPSRSDARVLLRNLVNRDLAGAPGRRRFAKLMLSQARTVERPGEELRSKF